MAGERSYVRVPPDSTGKKVRHEPFHRVGYNTRVGGHIWQLEQTYTINGISGTIFTGPNSDTGYVGFKMNSGSDFQNVDLPAGAAIVYEGSQVATVASDEVIHIPYAQISGGSSPHNTVNVDNTGSMNIRFSEGLPQLDAFGRLRVSGGTTLGDYIFAYNTLPNDFSTRKVGNATTSHDIDLRAIKLVCPSGVPAAGSSDAAGGFDLVAHTTNTYHHYFPGYSHEAIMTVALGDTGKNGCTRNWGYFDSQNGYMFRCDDASSGLKLVIRTNTSGSVTETVITEFNGDPVDGTGDSQMTLSLTDDNIYWIDIQWLGAGRVRFGTYHRGQRVVIHEHYHEGTVNEGKPSSQTGALPICFSMKNSTSQASETVMLAWCAAVHTEHDVALAEFGTNRLETITKTFDPTSLENGQEYELVGVLAPVKTITGDVSNRSLYLPNYMEAIAYHADGTEALIEMEVYLDPLMGGGNKAFSINQDEITDSATAWMVPVTPVSTNAVEVYKPENYVLADRPKFWGGGGHIHAAYMRGYTRENLGNIYTNFQDGAFKNYAENGGTIDHPITSITTGTTTTYSMGTFLRHREGYPIRIYGVTGTAASILNYTENGGTEFYLRVTSANTAELYTDIQFTTPVNTNGLTVTDPGRMRGDYGQQMYFVAVVKPLAPTIASASARGAVTVHFNLGWSEVNQ